MSKSIDPPAEITPEGWVQKEEEKAEILERLRKNAATADPDDPFALTEKEIEELAKRDEIWIF